MQILGLACCFFLSTAARGETADAKPGRIVTSYALTAPQHKDPDQHDGSTPKDWRLLGSNDDGNSWQVIDVRTNEMFSQDHPRRVFTVTNQTSYSIYRLDVTRSRDGTEAASLAELEFMGPVTGLTNEALLRTKITSSRSHPLRSPASGAFDGDPTTDWYDYGLGKAGGRWIQCQYITNAEIVVNSIGQLLVAGRGYATGNPIEGQASQVFSNFVAGAVGPARRLVGYSITSANDFYARDPADWQLLASNDGGKTWDVVDVRHNESFPKRLQRRDFTLSKPALYSLYRLQIDSVFTPATANSVQLAKVEPHWASGESTAGLSLVVSARGENPPWEVVQRAFDNDLVTKWLDFSPSTNRASWIQWQFAAINGPPVVSLNQLRTNRSVDIGPLKLDVQGIILGRNSDSVSLADATGFTAIRLATMNDGGKPGDRVRLKGDLEFVNNGPLLLHPSLTVFGPVRDVGKIQPGQTLEDDYVTATVEGNAELLARDADYSTLRMVQPGDGRSLLVRFVGPNRGQLPNLVNSRLRVHGVVESVTDEGGHSVPGVIWVSRISDVTLVPPTEENWRRWPEYPIAELADTNLPPKITRVTGTASGQSFGRYAVLRDGTNSIGVFVGDNIDLPAGTRVEAVGLVGHESTRTVLRWAVWRPAKDSAKPSDLAIDAEHPVTEISEVRRLRKINPDVAFPVRLRGIITYISGSYITDDNFFYLQDGTNAIIVLNATAAGLTHEAQQEGMYVEITGVNLHDGISPTAFAKLLGKAQMPEPVKSSFDSTMSPKNAERWSQVEGVVSGYNDGRLTLLLEGKELTVWVNQIALPDQCRVPGTRVRVSGVSDPILNNRDQMLGWRLLVPYTDCIEVISAGPADPFSLPKIPMGSVMVSTSGTEQNAMEMVKTEGTVTYKGSQMLCLQDKDGGMRVFLQRENTSIKPGDRVEVVGLALPDGFSPKLVQSVVRRIGKSDLPTVGAVEFTQAYSQSGQDAVRGQVDAILEGTGISDSAIKLELRCEATRRDFFAYLPVKAPLPSSLVPGTRVRLSGVVKFQIEEPLDANQLVTAFEMYLNSPEDIQVLEAAPWWTAKHTAWVLGGLVAVLIVSLAWISALRRRVTLQSGELKLEAAERKETQAELARERDLLRVLMDNTNDLIYFKDRDSRITECSKSFHARLGMSRREILGKSDADFLTPECTEKFMEDEQTIMGTGQPMLGSVDKNVTKDGKVIWYLTSKMPLRDESGAVVGTFGISKDVTALKEAEEKVRFSEIRFRSIWEKSSEAMRLIDDKGIVLAANPAFCQVVNMTADQLVGKPFTAVYAVPQVGSERMEQFVQRFGKRNIETREELHIVFRSGKSADIDLSNCLIEIEGGRTVLLSIGRDITARKQNEANLEKVHRELVDASRKAGMAEVATSVLHNVGNVLNSVNISATVVLETVTNSKIKAVGRLAALIDEHKHHLPEFFASDPKGRQVPGYLDNLAAELKKEQQKLIGEIQLTRKNIEHIKEIVVMQQSYAKFSGLVEKIDPAELVEDAVRMNEAALKRHEVQIIRDFAPCSCDFTVEKHKVLQILTNLIRNAKYACDDSNRSDKQITLELRNGNGRIRFSVVDNGVGIPPENMSRIFNHGFTTRVNGHGFGLHSGALAAKEMGGALTAHSGGTGTGARFTLDLPIKPPFAQ